ncbi:MAG: tRNA (adenosine(37)-N6)-threonylcarbamoyltransferase complex transferase subunit TsaD [Candidatus Delongbacteria bacterium]
MLIMGIESSCDDTSVSVLEDGNILSVAVNTQPEHSKFGGIIPELASRAHLKNFPEVTKKALEDAKIEFSDIDAFGVTYGPGLVGPLLVGVNFAKGLAFSLKKPLVPVNHIEAHIFANFIEHKNIKYPFIALVVSGGHTELVYVPEFEKYELIGKTRDDAAGECIDKVSKMLGQGFPGGRVMDGLAAKGDRGFEKFPRGMHGSTDFSFSGLKTALKYYIEKHDKKFIENNLANIAAAFLDSVTDSLTDKLFESVKKWGVRSVLLAGGVSANSLLRSKVAYYAKKKNIDFYYPSPKYCTDNAAMIAATAYLKIEHHGISKFPFDAGLDAVPFLKLS